MDDEGRESGQWWPSRGPHSVVGIIITVLFLLFYTIGWATGIIGNNRVLAVGYVIAAVVLSTMIALGAKKIYSRQREPNPDKADRED
ncbi:MAG: hypothetical protein ABSB89_04780 [Candidatus Bathyarchaeia archaeon]|jgi:multisubunit Na+/H+ antiporter MnhG subunit